MTRVSLRAALLGFLALEPTTGYTLWQRFEGSIAAFWTVTRSQIYRELAVLERDGLVKVKREPGEGKPDRKVHSLTRAGKLALGQWLEEPLEALQLRHPLLLKLVFAAEADPAALDTLLAEYRRSLQERRDALAARLQSQEIFELARTPREALLWSLSIENGLAFCDAELAWLVRARRRLAKTPSTRAEGSGA